MVRKILNRRARRDLREDRRALVRWFDRRNCDKAHETLADPLAAWEARSADIKLETAEYEHADKNERKTFKPSNPLCTDTCPIILHANSLNFPSHRQSFPVEAVAASMHPRKLFLRSQSCVQLSGTNALASFVDKTAFSGLISPCGQPHLNAAFNRDHLASRTWRTRVKVAASKPAPTRTLRP
jgi:hypothetical protein